MVHIDRLPPLRAMLVLEALQRTGSVTGAARMLNVSHSAVSHQIRMIEEWSGVHLVVRDGRRTILTDAGDSLARVAHDCFNAMRHEMDRLTMRERMPVTIASMPLVTSQWLIGQVEAFMAQNPDISVHVADIPSDRNMSPQPDISILFSLNGDIPAGASPLLSGRAIPVCAPTYLEAHPIGSPADIARARLLHDEDSRMWDLWFATVGLPSRTPGDRGLLFLSGSAMLHDAALKGYGIAICRENLIAEDLRSGRLIAISDVGIDDEAHYFIQPSASEARRRAVMALHDWLLRAARPAAAA
ncbi:LysR family transcriptional regulator [Arsenicitalea aurantiaca]|nr:LysR family transcriptional regulator [Arsenicitalea aurantiaca]